MFAKFARLVPAVLAVAACAPVADPVAAPNVAPRQGQTAWAAACKDDDAWTRAGPPFRVFGNTWYVGTCGIGAVLVAGSAGHIVIDGGPLDSGGLVVSNIVAAGFRPADVKALTFTHEHHDHVGGLAEVQRATGAPVYASPGAAAAIRSGKVPADDPQFGDLKDFPAVPVAHVITDRQPLRVGSLSLTPYFVPGHSPGAMTWQWRSCEGSVCKTIVYADSLSAVAPDSYRFTDHPAYVAAFRASLARVAALDCDILLTPHPIASKMRARLVAGDLAQVGGCREYAARQTKRLDDRLAMEAATRG